VGECLVQITIVFFYIPCIEFEFASLGGSIWVMSAYDCGSIVLAAVFKGRLLIGVYFAVYSAARRKTVRDRDGVLTIGQIAPLQYARNASVTMVCPGGVE